MKIRISIANIITGLLLLGAGFGLAWLFLPGGEEKEHVHSEVTVDTHTIWTCAMDPQVRQDEPGACPICGMDLTPLEDEKGGAETENVLTMTETALRMADIRVSAVTRAHGSTLLRLNGYVEADEGRRRSLAAHFPGRVEQMYVAYEGEYVKKGSNIALIYSPEVVTAQEELLEAIRFKDLNPGLVDAARRKLRLWKIPEAQIAEIEKTGKVKEELPVHADVGGTVLRKKVRQGDHVKEGQVLFDVADLGVVWVIFEVYERDLARIQKGNPMAFSVPSLPGKTFQGKVTFVDPVVDKQKGVAHIRLSIRNRKGLLKPGMYTEGRLLEAASVGQTSRLLVPKSAVLWTGKRSVVYVREPGREIPAFSLREVQLGERIAAGYEILSGLREGEKVVTQGAFVVDASAVLKGKSSMMQRKIFVKGGSEAEVATAIEAWSLEEVAEVSAEFMRGFTALVTVYMAVKDALVASDAQATAMAASRMVMQVSGVPEAGLSEAGRIAWGKVGAETRQAAGLISGTKVIAVQRTAFIRLSNAMAAGLQAFGASEAGIYLQHCPMANENQGADWLSRDYEIRNPYFGDAMLTCGSVKQELSVRNSGK